QLPDLERRSVGKLRRKRQQRGLRTQRLGKIHHTQTPGSKFFKQLRQNLRHSYSLLTNLLCAGDRPTSGRRTRSLPLKRLDISSELETILYQGEIGDISGRTLRFYFGDNRGQLHSLQCPFHGGPKILNGTHREYCRNSSCASDPFQIRTRASCGRKTSNR